MADERRFPLVDGACPAVLTTSRGDGSALTSPVWVGVGDDAFEIVMTANDGKVRNLQHDALCLLVMFETVPPFRGVEARGRARIETGARVHDVRRRIASAYLGSDGGERFADARADTPSVIVCVPFDQVRTWDLSGITA